MAIKQKYFFRYLVTLAGVLLFLVPNITNAALGPGISKGSFTIPDSYLTDWTQAGVEGGVPDTANATLWPVINTDLTDISGDGYNCTHLTTAEKSDTVNDDNKIQCYINYATGHAWTDGRQGTVIKLGVGTFYVLDDHNGTNSIAVKSNTVLRGSGNGTVIHSDAGGAGKDANCNWGGRIVISGCGSGVASAITSPLPVTVGTTNITVANGSLFPVGMLVWAEERNRDTSLFTVAIPGLTWETFLKNIAKVQARNGNVITLDRPIHTELHSAWSAQLQGIQTMVTNAGVEDLKIENQDNLTNWRDSRPSVQIALAINVWVQRVYSYRATQTHFAINNATHVTIQHNRAEHNLWQDHAAANGDWVCSDAYGVSFGLGSSHNLVTDNIFYDQCIGVTISQAANHNVVSYNYYLMGPTLSVNSQGAKGTTVMTHGMYPYQNLIEGNDGDQGNIIFDNWWGKQGPKEVFYRNRWREDNPKPSTQSMPGGVIQGETNWGDSTDPGRMGIMVDSWTFANESWFGAEATPFCEWGGCGNFFNKTANFWLDHVLWRDTSTASGRGLVGRESPGIATLVATQQGTTPPSAWSTFNFPASFYLTTKPSWWCDETTWPAIGANIDNFTNNPANLNKLPAQRRFEGLPCTTSGGTVTPLPTDNPPSFTSFSISPTTVTVNSSVTFSASVSDDNGVAGVQFYVNGNAQGNEVTTGSAGTYTFSYSPIVAGTYTIIARVRDTTGQTTNSSSVTLTVNSINLCGNGVIDSGEQCDGTNLNGQTCSSLSLGFTGGVLSCSSSCTFNTTSCTSNTGSCTTSTTLWQNIPFTSQSTPFTAEFDVTPRQAGSDSVTALSTSAGTAYTNFAVLILFGNTNLIQARNGANYGANTSISYTPGVSYHLRLVIDPVTKRYSAYIRPAGGTEQTLATNFAFRSEQSTASSLANLGIIAETGGHQVCNFTVTTNSQTGGLQNLSLTTPTLDINNLSSVGRSFYVSFYNPGGTTALSTSIVTGTSGTITFTPPPTGGGGLPPGTYDVRVKRDGSLYRKKANLLLSNGTFLGTFSPLISGDLNADNAINALDWSMMSPDWFQTNKASDINGDGITNALDFTWLNRNWFLIGE